MHVPVLIHMWLPFSTRDLWKMILSRSRVETVKHASFTMSLHPSFFLAFGDFHFRVQPSRIKATFSASLSSGQSQGTKFWPMEYVWNRHVGEFRKLPWETLTYGCSLGYYRPTSSLLLLETSKWQLTLPYWPKNKGHALKMEEGR